MRPIDSVNEAVAQVDAFAGDPRVFSLCLAESLFDPVGMVGHRRE
jgi:hypothetical protein